MSRPEVGQVLPTTVMGSYPQPKWLVDPDRLLADGVARVRSEDVWVVDVDQRLGAIEAATLQAIADQEDAGVDIITDGEIGRESYFNHFANSLGGVDRERIGSGLNRIGGYSAVPLVSGEIIRTAPVELDAARFLRRHTTRMTKVTVPGPFTLSQLAQNDYYPTSESWRLPTPERSTRSCAILRPLGSMLFSLMSPTSRPIPRQQMSSRLRHCRWP
jgi:5-methyltetrahydropteroyltriglutamate--homocysteine methyltransferase